MELFVADILKIFIVISVNGYRASWSGDPPRISESAIAFTPQARRQGKPGLSPSIGEVPCYLPASRFHSYAIIDKELHRNGTTSHRFVLSMFSTSSDHALPDNGTSTRNAIGSLVQISMTPDLPPSAFE